MTLNSQLDGLLCARSGRCEILKFLNLVSNVMVYSI